MNSERIIFEKKKESRGWYFVEYSPPNEFVHFALAELVVLENVEKIKIAEAIEAEARFWFTRYAVPTVVSAYDDKENSIHLQPIKDNDSLTISASNAEGPATLHWRWPKEEELNIQLDANNLKKIYYDIQFRTWTNEDVKRVGKEQRRTVVTAWIILFIWLIVIPLTVIILGETNVWVSRMVLTYSVWKVLVQLLKLTGHWKKSAREEEKAREDQEKEHHHYHCKKNPEGFLRLKIENFEKETRERVHKEAEALKQSKPSPDPGLQTS